MFMLTILLFFLFISGLMIGSFLNVLIYRLENKKRKTLKGRSFCPNCEEKITWHDNIPVISWLMLGGKCRSCKKSISIQYPLVELGAGLVFVVIGWFSLFSGKGSLDIANAEFILSLPNGLGMTGGWLFFASCLIIIFVYDLKHQIIPDEIIYTLLVVGLLFVGINSFIVMDYKYLIDHLASGLLAGGFFFFLAAVSKGKWMGGGDIKLAAFMGLVLGWQGVLVALYIAFILGAVFGCFALLTKEKKLSSKIPFGPFLVIGTMVSLVFSKQIISFYVKMFL